MQKLAKYFSLILFTSVLAFSFSGEDDRTAVSPNTKVYICVSEGAYAYHYDKDCRGLKNCKHDIKEVTLDEAFKKGKKKLCGWED
jgi:hypothetical protein